MCCDVAVAGVTTSFSLQNLLPNWISHLQIPEVAFSNIVGFFFFTPLPDSLYAILKIRILEIPLLHYYSDEY